MVMYDCTILTRITSTSRSRFGAYTNIRIELWKLLKETSIFLLQRVVWSIFGLFCLLEHIFVLDIKVLMHGIIIFKILLFP